MAEPAKRSAAERLQALPLAIKRCEQKIDDAFEHKRELLRQYGAASLLAGRARRQLRDLKDLRLDLIEERVLLEPLVVRERSELANPSTAAACDEFLSGMEARLAQLRAAQRAGAVSAGVDDEADKLVVRIGEIRKRRDYLRKFEAAA